MHKNRLQRLLPHWYLVLVLVLTTLLLPTAQAQTPAPRYFRETGHYLRGAFRAFWEQRGGLSLFGFPVTEEYYRGSDGRIVQFFERARFELTVVNNNAVVELGRLGVEVTGGKIFPQIPPFNSTASRRYFPETGHSLQGAFKVTWDRRGDLAIFGYPISEEVNEQLSDGRFHIVQYFERYRMELWGSEVRFGLLGRELAPPALLARWPEGAPPAGPLTEDARAPAAPPPPAAVRANPGRLTYGQSFAVEGEGFLADEPVALWITAPDDLVRGVGARPVADGNGSISTAGVRIGIDSSYGNGTWRLTAQGIYSGRAGIATFTVGTQSQPQPTARPGRPQPTARPAPPQSPLGTVLQDQLTVSGNGAITPLGAQPGVAFTFRGGGFDPAELISAWLTTPAGVVEPLDERLIQRDGQGNITIVFGTESRQEGIWAITAQGRTRGGSVIAQFKLTREFVAPLGTPRPPNVNGTVSPAEGGRRAVFQISATGFRANEVLEHWITSPEGVYFFVGTVRADARGRVGYNPGQRVQFGNNPTGVYGYHYRGTQSRVRADVYLTYNGAP